MNIKNLKPNQKINFPKEWKNYTKCPLLFERYGYYWIFIFTKLEKTNIDNSTYVYVCGKNAFVFDNKNINYNGALFTTTIKEEKLLFMSEKKFNENVTVRTLTKEEFNLYKKYMLKRIYFGG